MSGTRSESEIAAVREVAGRLPIFPLPNAVLLPGALLPLHVFEPRYRALIAEALDPRRRGVLAVAMLERGHDDEYLGRPPVRPFAGAGVLVGHEKLPDGRYHILLHGVARVRLLHELPPDRPYREVQVEVLAERDVPDGSPAAEAEALLASLRALCEAIAARRPDVRSALLALVHEPRSPGEQADVLGASLIVSPDARQAVLERLDPVERLRLVVDEVGRLLAALGGPQAAG